MSIAPRTAPSAGGIAEVEAAVRVLGAAGTVTGSRFLVRSNGQNLLVDCGLFQGGHDLEDKNWQPFPTPRVRLKPFF